MTPPSEAAARLAEIDALQDDVLEQLAELERKCQVVLDSCQSVLSLKRIAAEPSAASGEHRTSKRKAA